MRDKIRPLIKYQIGDGADTWLWLDNWLPMGPIVSVFGNDIVYESGLPRNAKVLSIIQNGQWLWPVANSPDLLILKTSITTNLIPRCTLRDKAIWVPSHTGAFSTKSAWNEFREA